MRMAGLALVVLIGGALWVTRAEGVWPWPHDGQADGRILLSGNIEAHTSALSFKGVQSRLLKLPFDEGASVKAGDVLAVLDKRDLDQQIQIAEAGTAVQQRQLDSSARNVDAAHKTLDVDQAALQQRELDLKRAEDLQSRGFVSDAALDTARTALTQARATLARDQALARLAERNVEVARASVHSAEQAQQLSHIQDDYATLKAPFDGVVIARQAELGEVVAPGTPVVTLADLDHVWLRAYLNETDLGRVRLGQAVTVRCDAFPRREFTGRLSFIASQAEFTPKSVETHAERVTLVYRVKIDLDNPGHQLLPGMPADAQLQALPAP
jgi:HlyD family secretion protein